MDSTRLNYNLSDIIILTIYKRDIMTEQTTLCIIGMKNGKPITKRVTSEELKELNKPVEPKKTNCTYDPFRRYRRGNYMSRMYGR